jgi:hypothetical protein
MTSDSAINGLEAWDVSVDEVSQGCFSLTAVRNTGNRFEKSGADPDQMMNELREFEATIHEGLERRKLTAKS